MVTPRTPAPALDLPLVGGGRFRLADQQPDQFTMVVFYRGYHCPVCRKQLAELDRRLGDLHGAGITSVVAVSGDTEDRARASVDEWHLSDLPVAYGQTTDSMREWGLFVSSGIKEPEPEQFGEPGLFLVRPDNTVYWELVSSMPFSRPSVDEVLLGVQMAVEHDYPARGELAA